MSAEYKIAETATFSRNIKNKKYSFLYAKIKEYVYPLLRKNPFFGPSIKKLKGEFKDLYRFRIGKYRLFYKIEKKKIIVFIIAIKRRKDTYK